MVEKWEAAMTEIILRRDKEIERLSQLLQVKVSPFYPDKSRCLGLSASWTLTQDGEIDFLKGKIAQLEQEKKDISFSKKDASYNEEDAPVSPRLNSPVASTKPSAPPARPASKPTAVTPPPPPPPKPASLKRALQHSEAALPSQSTPPDGSSSDQDNSLQDIPGAGGSDTSQPQPLRHTATPGGSGFTKGEAETGAALIRQDPCESPAPMKTAVEQGLAQQLPTPSKHSLQQHVEVNGSSPPPQ